MPRHGSRRSREPKTKAKSAVRFKSKSSIASKSTTLAKANRVAGYNATSIQRGYLPLGKEFLARLPYCETFTLTAPYATNVSSTIYTYRTNDIYDPRVEVGGHQPLQFDTLATVYHRVWVWGAKVTMVFTNPSNSGAFVGYRIRQTGDTSTTSGKALDYMMEMRNSVVRPIPNTGKQSVMLNTYINNPRVQGMTKAQYSDINNSHLMTGDPTNQIYLEPFALTHNASADTTVQCTIKVIYYCQFTQGNTSVQS